MNSKMATSKKILILHPHFTLAGGAGNFVLEVGSRLFAKGYEITVCTIRCDPELIKNYKDSIQFIDIGGALSSSFRHWLTLPIFLFKLFRTCDRLSPDLIFAQVFPSNWWGFIYKALRPKTKLLWMCQEPSAFIHSKTWIAAITDPAMNFVRRHIVII